MRAYIHTFIHTYILYYTILCIGFLTTVCMYVGRNRSRSLLVSESLSGHRVRGCQEDFSSGRRLQRHGQLDPSSGDRQDSAFVCGRVHQRNSKSG